ncbi:MAG TPA: hypothetical protein VEI97_06900, partial [bacterium]|nr:hypothetical protein [bacterium]
MRAVLPPLVTGLLLLGTLGCSNGSHPLSSSPIGEEFSSGTTVNPRPSMPVGATAGLGAMVLRGDTAQSAAALYRMTIDAAALTADVTLAQVRRGQATDDLYLLSIDGFLTPGALRVTEVGTDGSTLSITYELTHPFPGPTDPTGTPNATTNRADLGVSGIVLFLTDVGDPAGDTYFGDRVAETTVITDPDGYYAPGALITAGTTANTFPYKRIVNEEGEGNRVGIPNGGDPTGNFGADGWTRAELGSNNNGWTGYSAWHQGQTVQGGVALSLAAFTGGSFVLDFAVICRYQDPRGGSSAVQKKANRLPPATPDPTKFAYRGNHLAW